MARAQLLIEGFAADELKAMAKRTSLLPLFAGKPVAVTYGSSTLLGGVKKSRGRLIVEVAAMQGAVGRVLPMLKRLAREIAVLRGIRTLEWRLPNQKPQVERL
jgi:hypothetical protein